MNLDFRLLGPVEVWAGGRAVHLGSASSAKARCILAVLLRSPGEVVQTDVLVERVWGEQVPGRDVRYKYIGWLRSVLGEHGAALDYRAGGYVLNVSAEQVDLHRFRKAVAEAHRGSSDAPGRAVAAFELALSQWRGDALTGIQGSWASSLRAQLERERVGAVVDMCELRLDSDTAGDIAGIAAGWAESHPTDERLAEVLMRALDLAGRRSDALAVYAGTRRRIVEMLDTLPGPRLDAVREDLQNGRSMAPQEVPLPHSSQPTVGPWSARPPPHPVPRQLPPATRHFSGRERELDWLTNQANLPRQPGSPVICQVTGMAGIGKTALALRWAHLAAGAFPDGQLYIDLNGFGPGTPVDSQAVIGNILDAFAVSPDQIPRDSDARVSFYRSLIAGRRCVIILDNVRDSAQVRPLLPSTSSCLVIVTSRRRLTGLLTTEGAAYLPLQLLDDRQARDLITARLLAVRGYTDVQAVDDLAGRCSGLPLALALVSSRVATMPDLPLDALGSQLRSMHSRLDLPVETGGAESLRAVFSWSYEYLDPDSALLFRTLGAHPSTEMSFASVASAGGLRPAMARMLVDRLLESNLIEEKAPDRYRMHDLLREYALELAADRDPADQRQARMRRLLGHYLHSAFTAAMLIDSQLDPIDLPVLESGTWVEALESRDEALQWFTREHASLLAVVGWACESGFETVAWRLAWTLSIYQQIRGHWFDRVDVQRRAVEAASRINDALGEAHARRGLGIATQRVGAYDESERQLERALELFEQLDDVVGQARTRNDLAYIYDRLDQSESALHQDEQALSLFRSIGHQAGEATALNSIGWNLARLGRYQDALTSCTRALQIMEEVGDRSGQAATWDSIALAHERLGDSERALECYALAAEMARDLGELPLEGEVLHRLGKLELGMGRRIEGLRSLERAASIMERIDPPEATAIRADMQVDP
ncbi:BTAD domain-containing putative transcriptional regulator [Streptomyces sp. SID13031]|uniref:AfsR/SARP family transcriptional regulator n=1 Tax=Streptomyces sp. SID13031 TaxID=2706046 RepID=UPI0013CB6B06|nr:BTAD domain-containing putative transcriptional regulator [Streptomyces sp. SID13031]NEA30749.1 tetratricopeptide repeat protein [Streptomyces sp. SID13031]